MNVPVRLFDTSLNLLAEIDDYESLYFERMWYEDGQFNITINKNKLYASLLAQDVIVMVGNRSDSIGIITQVQEVMGEDGKGSEEIIASGFQLKHIFARRNVEPLAGKARYAIPGDITIIEDAGNPIFNYDFYVSRVMVGDVCHIYYTDAGTLYHRTASDVLLHTWSGGAACTIGGGAATNCAYPFVFYSGSTYYMILQRTNDASPYSYYMYTSSDGVAWTITNGGNKVLTAGSGIYTFTWGASIVLVDGYMYLFTECATAAEAGDYGIGYSFATLASLAAGTCNFNTNATVDHIIEDAGCPSAVYVPDKNAFMLFHGYVNYDDITYWELRVSSSTLTDAGAYYTPDGWVTSNNWNLALDSMNALNPSFLALPASKTYDLLLGYLYNNASNYQDYFDMTLNEFYNIISANIPAETVVKQLVNDQAAAGAGASRLFPNLLIATDQARGVPYVLSARYSVLSAEMKDFAYKTNLCPDIRLDLVNKDLIFDVYAGLDRVASQSVNGRAIFSADFNTIRRGEVTHSDINYRNLMIVGGKGAGSQRYIYKYYGTTEPTGFDRRELFVDAREIEDFAIPSRAKNELEKYINEHTIDIEGLEYSGLQYRTDYDVGDICTIVVYDDSLDVRLAGVTESWEAGNYEMSHIFGKPYPTVTSKMAQSQSETRDNLSATEEGTSTGGGSSTGGSTTTIVVVNDEISNLNQYPLFARSLSGSVVPHADSGLTYNPYTGTFSAVKFDSTSLDVSGVATIGTLDVTDQRLIEYTIPGSTNKILQFKNTATGQTSGDVHSIFEIRSPDTATAEATLSQHIVLSGTDDWVRDVSFHNYAGTVKAVDVLSHFTGTNAGKWEWVSRYTTGTDYDMIDRTLMSLAGDTGNAIIGEDATITASARGKLDVRSYGNTALPTAIISLDSSNASQPNALIVENGLNYAYDGDLVALKVLNATDTATVLKLENAGSGYYLVADAVFNIAKNGDIASSGNFVNSGNKSFSNSFSSGFAGAGWRIDYGVGLAGKSSAEFDNLTIRNTTRIYELLINQIRATNGSVFVSSTGKIAAATLLTGTIGVNGSTYTLETDDNTDHGFAVNDLIRAQRFTGTGTYQVDLQVTAVASDTEFTATLIGTNAYIDAIGKFNGLEFVRLGNTTDAARKGSVYLTADDSNAPFIDIVDGIAAHSDWNTAGKIKARLGKLSGITSTTFGTLSGYGLWSENVYLEGAIKATSGEIGSFTIGTYLYTGSKTAFDDLAAGVHIGSDGIGLGANFYVSAAGSLFAQSGTIGGWTLGASRLSSTNVFIDQSGQYISMGATPPTSYGNNVGAWFGVDTTAKMSLYADANNYLQWDGSKLLVKAANFTLDSSGNVTATNAAISGVISNNNAYISSADIILWTGASITGRTAPAVGDLRTYIYTEPTWQQISFNKCTTANTWTSSDYINLWTTWGSSESSFNIGVVNPNGAETYTFSSEGVFSASSVNSYKIDDDATPIDSKTATDTALSFTVYKPMNVRTYLSGSSGAYLYVRSGGTYTIVYRNIQAATTEIFGLMPGNYRITPGSGETITIDCISVYGSKASVGASLGIWS